MHGLLGGAAIIIAVDKAVLELIIGEGYYSYIHVDRP